jgi:hypothetical protein
MRTRFPLAALAAVCLTVLTAFAPTPPGSDNEKTTSAKKGHAYGHDEPGTDSPALKVRMDMRKLWEDHIVYTRNYVVSATSKLPDAQPVLDRLLRNQDEIGNAIKPYYGEAAGAKLATLLREHITIAGEVVKAAMANDTASLTAQQAKWSANGKSIAVFLSGANPNWKQADLEQMMQTHLDLLTKQVTARLNKDWIADIKAYDDGHDHILQMADALSNGIMKQFPDKFAQASR